MTHLDWVPYAAASALACMAACGGDDENPNAASASTTVGSSAGGDGAGGVGTGGDDGHGGSVGGSGGTPVGTGGAGGTGGSGGSPTSICEADEVIPVGTDDVVYDAWTGDACMSAPCLCSSSAHDFVAGLLACDAVQGGFWWGLGSMYLRVTGRSDGACIVRVGMEVEGGVDVHECTLPLPMAPWGGLAWMEQGSVSSGFLDGIEAACPVIGSCSLLFGGPDACSEATELAPPLCPAGNAVQCAP